MSWESPPADAYTVLLDLAQPSGAVRVADIKLWGRSIFPDLARMWPVPWAESGHSVISNVVLWRFEPDWAVSREEALGWAEVWIKLHRENYLRLVVDEAIQLDEPGYAT